MIDRKLRDEWVLTQKNASFLQSFEWGEFKRQAEQEIEYFDFAGEKVLALKNFVKGFGYYWFVPKGPLTSTLPKLIERAKSDGAFFLRVEPGEVAKNLSMKKVTDIHPANSLVLDLIKSEDELMVEMHSKTRYNIGLAQRKGVTAEVVSDSKVAVNTFMTLARQTAKRDGFRLHSENYYQLMSQVFSSNELGGPELVWYEASFGGKAVASLAVMYFGTKAIYLHGASSDEQRQTMAAPLAQWTAILDAKKRGFKTYDLWGVAPEGASNRHPWYGITRFKLGFGGRRVDSPGTYDIVLSPWRYALYSLVRLGGRWLRRSF